MKRGSMNVVLGAQAGSEAKGKLSGWLVRKFKPEYVASCLSPNAGHTIVLSGQRHISHHIPICSIMDNVSTIVMGPASVINLEKLAKELFDLCIDRRRLLIDPRAAIIQSEMIHAEERSMTIIGSTAQGVGLARVAKLMRYEDAKFFGDLNTNAIDSLGIRRDQIVDTSSHLNRALEAGSTVLYEMSQGFDLCLEHGIDRRYCTSRIVNPAMAFAESGVSLRYMGDIYGVLRPYPIRVNNRDGYSGPYAEANEITWEEVARRCEAPEGVDLTELTTTTKLPRRVFEFSYSRFRKFLQICSPTYLCLNFVNYLDYECLGARKKEELSEEILEFVDKLEAVANESRVAYLGSGPDHLDMIDLGVDE